MFTPPNENTRVLIDRILAVPGDRLVITNGTVSINGRVISEPYVPQPWTFDNSWPADGHEVIVAQGQFFLMGDNRNHSSDSRSYGFVDVGAIQGRVLSGK